MSLDKTIKGLKTSFSKELSNCKTSQDLENFRIKYLGRNGKLASLFEEFNKLPAAEKPRFGKELNILKNQLTSLYQNALGGNNENSASNDTDFSLPGYNLPDGNIHPLEQITSEIKSIFQSIGFSVAYGPEIDDDYHNFEALNVPKHHPARDMQDTFFINPNAVLRTHTSPVQVRCMLKHSPPMAFISGGKVYRKDDDATHLPMFHQIEGIFISKDVSFANLKDLIYKIVFEIFEESTELRFRPSFFPFTEPSAEVDIGYRVENNKIIIGEGDKWLEVLGCGMVHPNVLRNVKVDTKKYQGFAFGMGIDRLAMLKYGINDLRAFFETDFRWLSHFGFDPLDVPTNYRGLSK